MRLADTRPPFAGLANLSEAALAALPTPCYLLDEARLRRNGEILLGVQQRTGCKILLAQKAFSNYDLYPVLAPYLAGCTSTPCASRIPTRWRPPCPRWKRNSVTCCPG